MDGLDSMVHYELVVKECTAEVWLNDIPVCWLDAKVQKYASVVAHPFLIDGPNALELVACPGPEPARSRERGACADPAKAEAKVRVVRYDVGDHTGAPRGAVLSELSWAGAPGAPLPDVQRADFAFASPFGTWAWQHLAPLRQDEVQGAVLPVLRTVHDAFRRGDPRPILDLAGIFLDEEVRAHPGIPLVEMRARLERDIAENASRSGWVAPLDEDALSLRMCATGRLVECVTRSWEPAVRTLEQPDGDRFPFPLFLGRVGDRFEIIR